MRRSMIQRFVTALIPTSILSLTAPAILQAQDSPPSNTAIDEAHQGWNGLLSAIAGANVSEQKNVVGNADGSYNTYLGKVSGQMLHLRGLTEWRNSLDLYESVVRTPTIDSYIKSSDELKLETLYLDFFRDSTWLGTYARLAANTAVFEGYVVRPATTTFQITRRDGRVDTRNEKRLKLTDPFRPLTTKESYGVFAKPLKSQICSLEMRIGLGAAQTRATGQLALKDDASTPQVEVIALPNTREFGIETGLNLFGSLMENKLTYKVFAEALTPTSYSPKPSGNDRSVQALSSTEVGASAAFHLTNWSALNYEYRSKRQPLIQDAAQITQAFLLSVAYQSGY